MLVTFVFAVFSFLILIIFKDLNFIEYFHNLYDFISFKTLILLAMFIVTNKAYELNNTFKISAFYLLKNINYLRFIIIILVFLCFFSSMLVTNDAALLCFVPFSIYLLKELKKRHITMIVVILQTLAANLGSMLTPFGNPQNLFIYNYYDMNLWQFLEITFIYCLVSAIILLIFIFFIKNHKIKVKLFRPDFKIFDFLQISVAFFICIFCVIGVFDIVFGFFIVVLIIFYNNKKVFLKADYSIIIIFINLFIFVKNISFFIDFDDFNIFYKSIILSSLLSNVPACVFLANFTNDYKELLLGVNIGSLGTIIASMASVISYKYYVNTYKKYALKYILKFTFFNVLFLIFMILFYEFKNAFFI